MGVLTVSAMAYSKLHSSIVGSSLWNQSDSARLLFITLLALCDQDGIAYGSKDGLARMANIEPDDWQSAWDTLLAPDADSSDAMRAPENNGRRVEAVPGGFRLLNFKYYRGLRNDDDRREQNREAQARFKAKAKVSHAQPAKAQAEAEAEAEVQTVTLAETQATRPTERLTETERLIKSLKPESEHVARVTLAVVGEKDFKRSFSNYAWWMARRPAAFEQALATTKQATETGIRDGRPVRNRGGYLQSELNKLKPPSQQKGLTNARPLP